MPPRRTAAGGNGSGLAAECGAGAGGGDGRASRRPSRSSTPSGSACSARTARRRPPGAHRGVPQFLEHGAGWHPGQDQASRAEVQVAPDLLTPAWTQLVLTDLLGYTPAMLAEGGALPEDLRTGHLADGYARTRSPVARMARAAGLSGCSSTGWPPVRN